MPGYDDSHNFMTRDMRRTVLKLRILMRVKAGNIYPYALMKEFKKSNFSKFIGPTIKNDTYNSLNALEKSGYIKSVLKSENGKTKKYYAITKRGIKASASIKKVFGGMLKYRRRYAGMIESRI